VRRGRRTYVGSALRRRGGVPPPRDEERVVLIHGAAGRRTYEAGRRTCG